MTLKYFIVLFELFSLRLQTVNRLVTVKGCMYDQTLVTNLNVCTSTKCPPD